MKYDKQYLYKMYNATSTVDENGDLETYENWLERQLISRIKRLRQLELSDDSNRYTLQDMINAYDAGVCNPNDETAKEYMKRVYNVSEQCALPHN